MVSDGSADWWRSEADRRRDFRVKSGQREYVEASEVEGVVIGLAEALREIVRLLDDRGFGMKMQLDRGFCLEVLKAREAGRGALEKWMERRDEGTS